MNSRSFIAAANANLKKAVKKAVPQAARTYEKQLLEEFNEDRNEHDKKPFDETNAIYAIPGLNSSYKLGQA